MLLTNGGGKPEIERTADLQAKLGVPISPANFVQSHTPFKDMISDNWSTGTDGQLRNPKNKDSCYADKTVLVTGSDAAKARELAQR
jgi:ribonucleotide monophosphatase NagD (HAD superfamily)